MVLTSVEAGMIATVVTSLEMVERPRPRALPASPFRLTRWKMPASDKYRALFRRVGEPWLWFSRLVMPEEDLVAIIHHPDVAVHAVEDRRGIEIGMVEIDFRVPGEALIAFLGFVPELTGKRHGDWLMAQTLSLAWRKDVRRLWVHSCTLDHPGALGFYRRHGFTAFQRAIETFADPRLAGVLACDSASHVPILAPVDQELMPSPGDR